MPSFIWLFLSRIGRGRSRDFSGDRDHGAVEVERKAQARPALTPWSSPPRTAARFGTTSSTSASSARRSSATSTTPPAHLQGLTFHELRHTAASLSLSVSPDLNIVKQRLGHEDIRTTANIYGHLVPAADGALAARLAEMFFEAQQPDILVARPRG